MVMWLVAAALFVVLLVAVVGMYNGLIRKRIDCDNAFSQVDVQLKRRHDLIPNLVETVKGYASHESETLEAVIAARTRAVSLEPKGAEAAAAKGAAESQLTAALGRLFAVVESYPDLKANTNFAQLQEELVSTENKIGFSRQHYNDTVTKYENARQTIPTALVAAMFNFQKREMFTIQNEAEKQAPKVSFS